MDRPCSVRVKGSENKRMEEYAQRELMFEVGLPHALAGRTDQIEGLG